MFGYLKISQAAAFLGVSIGILRAWEKNKKLPCRRDPDNKYRLYPIAALQKFKEGHTRRYHKTRK